MTKYTLFVVLFFCVYQSSLSQSRYRFGVVAGVNYVYFRGTDVLKDTQSTYGFLGGLSVEYRINTNFALKSGLSFEQKGLNYNSGYSYGYFNMAGDYVDQKVLINTTNKYQFLTLPLLLKYSFTKSKSWFVNGGVFVSNFLDVKSKATLTNLTNNSVSNNSGNSGYNFPLQNLTKTGFDYGFVFGIGKAFKLKDATQINLELRDDYGVENFIGGGYHYGQSYGVIKANTISLIAEYSFTL